MIKDAAFMMFEVSGDNFKKEIDLLNNDKISEIEIKILWEGETALRDRKYWRLLLGSAKIFIPLIGATLTGIISLIRWIV